MPIEKIDPSSNPDQAIDYLDISSIDNKCNRILKAKRYFGKDAPSRARQLIKRDDILFSTVRTYLKNIAMVPVKYDGQVASTGFSILRAAEGINSKFLFYYTLTQDFLNPLSELQRGTSYPAVRDDDVRIQKLPIAPYNEQKRIVAKIEELFSELDKGIESLKTAREQLKVYRQAVLKHAFEGKLTAKWRSNYTKSPSKDGKNLLFTILPLSAQEATPKEVIQRYYEGGKHAWRLLVAALNDEYVTQVSEYITDAALEETNCKLYPPNTILVAMYGEGKTRGKASILKITAATNQACAAITITGTDFVFTRLLMWNYFLDIITRIFVRNLQEECSQI